MKIKKLLALGLSVVMVMSMAACGNDNGNGESQSANNNTNNNSSVSSDGTRTINIGTWWVQYYDSDDKLEDSPDYQTASAVSDTDTDADKEQKAFNLDVAQKKFDNVPVIEKKYNCEFYWQNLTITGVTDSINTSILAGSPDCDIYLVDAGMAIPAQMNGLAIDLKTVLPEDHDLFTEQSNMSYLDLGDGKACIIKRTEAQAQVEATYPLGFNMQMLEDAGLEDPRDLWERGEWTWDVFIQYCQTLTQDTDGDGQTDQYGFCGYAIETLEQLVMSNGASIASGTTETLTSSATGEALQMMYDMYNTYKICYPYDFESGAAHDTMRNQYTEGNIGFFPIAAWIASGNGDYDYDGKLGYTLPFDTAYVRWPVGYSGNADTNPGKNDVAGEFYIIPAGVQDPETVVNVLYDYWNWYGGDTTIRDNKMTLNWWYGVTAKENPASGEDLRTANFDVMADCGATSTLDYWNSMGITYDIDSLIRGDVTPAQFQETYKQQVQDGLDAYFK